MTRSINKVLLATLISAGTALGGAVKPALAGDVQLFTCKKRVNAAYVSFPTERGYGLGGGKSDVFASCVSAGDEGNKAGQVGVYITNLPAGPDGKNKFFSLKLVYKDDNVARNFTTVRLCAVTTSGQQATFTKNLGQFRTSTNKQGFNIAEADSREWGSSSIYQANVISCSIIVDAAKTPCNIRFGDIAFNLSPQPDEPDFLNIVDAKCVPTQDCFGVK